MKNSFELFSAQNLLRKHPALSSHHTAGTFSFSIAMFVFRVDLLSSREKSRDPVSKLAFWLGG
jgi:hypothetical protein